MERQIEYLVVCFDDRKREVKLSLRQADILRALAADEELIKQGGGVPEIQHVHVKYGSRSDVEYAPADAMQERRHCTCLSSRIRTFHARGYSRQTMGNRLQGPTRGRV